MNKIRKSIALILAVILVIGLCPDNLRAAVELYKMNQWDGTETRIIIKYKDVPAIPNEPEIYNILEDVEGIRQNTIKFDTYVIPSDTNPSIFIAELEARDDVEYVQIDYPLQPFQLSDEFIDMQWALQNEGQMVQGRQGVPGADIHVKIAYETAVNLDEVVVAVLDTGIDINHPELTGKIVSPWNFVENNDDVSANDGFSHGTNIAGIIAANHDNQGIAGVAPNAKIMPLKFMEYGVGYTSDVLFAVEYAKANGASIINCSWGGNNYNPILRDVMEQNKELLFICAAGNPNNGEFIYPAAFSLNNVIAVASTNNRDHLSDTSNYGPFVDISAPGEGIYTTALQQQYDFANGSSMAAAHVTGAAALYKGSYPQASAAQIKGAVIQGARAPIKGMPDNNDTYEQVTSAAIKIAEDNGSRYPGHVLDIDRMLEIQEVQIEEPDNVAKQQEVLSLDLENLPSEVQILLDRMFGELTWEQKELLSEWCFVREDTMQICADSGYSIRDSVHKAIMMQRLECDLTDVLKMIDAFGSEGAAYKQVEDFAEIRYHYIDLNGLVVDELTDLLIQGYSTGQVINAFIVVDCLESEKSVKDVIQTNNTRDVLIDEEIYTWNPSYDGIQELSNTTGKNGLERLAYQYGVEEQVFSEWLTSNTEYSMETLDALLSEYRNMTGLNMNQKVAPYAAQTEPMTYEPPVGAFSYRHLASDHVNMQNGSLVYTDSIVSLAGRNGLDLDLALRYNSGKASPTQTYVYMGFLNATQEEINKNWYTLINTLYFKPMNNVLTHMGYGWSFMFTQLEIGRYSHFPNYLVLPSGAEYAFDSNGETNATLELKEYKEDRMTLKKDSYNTYGAYVLEYADGVKEWFNYNGTITRRSDRYGNAITFEAKGGNNTVKITDTMNRIITIENNMYWNYNQVAGNVYINLPDGSKITYVINDGKLEKKTDQLGQVTTFSYTPMEGNFDYIGAMPSGPIYNRIAWIYEGMAGSNRENEMPKPVTNYNLTGVTYPTGAKSIYDYNLAYGYFPGETGAYLPWFPISGRFDQDGSQVYNQEFYEFDIRHMTLGTDVTNTYYSTVTKSVPKASDPYQLDNLKSHNSYSTESHVVLDQATWLNGQIVRKTDYVYNDRKLPAKVTTTIWNPGSGQNYNTVELYEYDNKSNITGYWRPQAEGNNGNTEYKISTTYDGTYQIPTSVTYKQNSETTIVENYSLTGDKKSIATMSVRVNGAEKARTNYTYDGYGNPTTIQDFMDGSASRSTTLGYKNGIYVNSKRVDAITETFEYDIMGNLLWSKDGKGYQTSYAYDRFGRVIKTILPDSKTITNTYVTNNSENSILVKDERDNSIKYNFDRFGNITSVLDVLKGQTLEYGAYDHLQRLIQVMDGNGNTTNYRYDYQGRLVRKAVGDSYAEAFDYDDAYTLSGTNYNRALKTIEGGGNAPSIRSVAYTDKYGNLIMDGLIQGNSEKLNTYVYDYLGRCISELSVKDKEAGRGYTRKYEVDHTGQVTKITAIDGSVYQTTYDWLGRQRSSIDPKGNESYYTYDALDRLIQERLPFEGNYYSEKNYRYDNNSNLIEETITNNQPGAATTTRKVEYAYNNRNQMTRVSNYDNNTLASYVDYEYDGAGNVAKMKTANGANATSYSYDQLNRLTKLVDPLNHEETYEYDANGNMIKKTDRNGAVISNTYDALNRLTRTSAAGAAPYLEYVYGKTGAVLSEKNENMTVSYQYDDWGRVILVSDSTGAEKAYEYDLNSNVTAFLLKQKGAAVTTARYDYDLMNRMEKVYDNNALIATYRYDENSNRAGLVYGNGIEVTYSYNKANLVTSLVNKRGSTTLSSFTYSYLLDGNQRTKTDHRGIVSAYTYNGLGQLVQEAETVAGGNNLVQSYEYDTAGNRNKLIASGREFYTTTYSYDANNRLTQDTKVLSGNNKEVNQYTYDNNGNQTARFQSNVRPASGLPQVFAAFLAGSKDSEGSYELNSFDVFNRLVGVENENHTITYGYRPDGMRQYKEVDGQRTTHLWNGGNIVADLDAAGAVKDRYLRGIDLVRNNAGYYLYNAHGDVVQLADNGGTVTRDYHYNAFGVEADKGDNDANPFRYCGEYYDYETGFVYLRARYYSPEMSRFTSEDTVKAVYYTTKNLGKVLDPLSLNLYTYCQNDPVQNIDPSGHLLGTIMTNIREYAENLARGLKRETIAKAGKIAVTQEDMANKYAKNNNLLDENGDVTSWNNEADAYKHFTWSFTLRRKFDYETSMILTDVHEIVSLYELDAIQPNYQLGYTKIHTKINADTLMDLWNNRVGRQLGSRKEFACQTPDFVFEYALNEGLLITNSEQVYERFGFTPDYNSFNDKGFYGVDAIWNTVSGEVLIIGPESSQPIISWGKEW